MELKRKKNIDVLEAIVILINHIKMLEDDIDIDMDINEIEISDLVARDDATLNEFIRIAEKINSTINLLTEDLRSALDYKEFDCESLEWCLNKIKYNRQEIENYYVPICVATTCLSGAIRNNISEYKILTQFACEGGNLDAQY